MQHELHLRSKRNRRKRILIDESEHDRVGRADHRRHEILRGNGKHQGEQLSVEAGGTAANGDGLRSDHSFPLTFLNCYNIIIIAEEQKIYHNSGSFLIISCQRKGGTRQ